MNNYSESGDREKGRPVNPTTSSHISSNTTAATPSVTVLEECISLQIYKSIDYQNPNSSVRQAMHYRRGLDTIHDMIEQKVLRARSLIEAAGAGCDGPENEPLEDTYKDIVNYCSFAVVWLRGEMDGQNLNNGMFNTPSSDRLKV